MVRPRANKLCVSEVFVRGAPLSETSSESSLAHTTGQKTRKKSSEERVRHWVAVLGVAVAVVVRGQNLRRVSETGRVGIAGDGRERRCSVCFRRRCHLLKC